jgi:hypothetical protein
LLVYNYDSITKEYINSKEARVSPIDKELLIPAHATLNKVIDAKEGYARCYIDNKWVYVEDHRGKVVYNTFNPLQESVVCDLGPINEFYTELEPFVNCIWKEGKWVLDTKKVIEANKYQSYINERDTTISSYFPTMDISLAEVDKIATLEDAKKVLYKLVKIVYILSKNSVE